MKIQLSSNFYFLIFLLVVTANLSFTQNQPNILLIIADDLGVDSVNSLDYGLSVSSQASTPNINNLKSDGVSFVNTWATPQCATTRAAIISGKYGINTGVRKVPGNLGLEHQSIFNYINNNISTDYSKAVIGKWHISNPIDVNHPYSHGVDYYEGVIGSSVSDYYTWDKVDKDGNTIEISEYVTKHFTDASKNWISSQTKPWFLWLAHVAPHSPFHVPPTGTYSQADLSGNRGKYLASIESLDYYIGDLLNSLDQDTKDNTIIIFIGDNGTPNGVARGIPSGHGKTTMYEGGLRVPLIISGKNIQRKGVLENGLVQATDIYATIIEMLGNSLEGGIYNSYSLDNSLSVQNVINRPYIYSDYIKDGVEYWSIRNNDYKLIQNENNEIEFFSLKDNLDELNNIVDVLTNEETNLMTEFQNEAYSIRNGWSCSDEILNGDEVFIDDCSCPNDDLTTTNIGCCETPTTQSIYYEYYENDKRKVYSNSYPSHSYCYNKSVPAPAYHDLEMDLNPTFTGNASSVINQITGRPASTFGISLNGVMFAPGPALPFVFKNPNTNEYNWDWVFEPTNNQGAGSDKVTLDCSTAHVSTPHGYHYHGEMFEYLETVYPGITTAETRAEVLQVGWAADGFPILYKFGPDESGVIKILKPSYKLKAGERPGDGISAPCGLYSGKYTNDYEYDSLIGDLDECNGVQRSITLMTDKGEETFPYFYVISSTFPQVPRCLMGNVNSSFANSKLTGTDNDGDGFIEPFDCDDNNLNVNPQAIEIPGNGIDENCDGEDTLSVTEYYKLNIQILVSASGKKVRVINKTGFGFSATLFDINGKEVLSKSESLEIISLENFSDSIYILKVIGDNNEYTKTQKIVRN